VSIATALATVIGLALIFSRFVFHHGADIDTMLMTFFTQLRQAQAANQQPMPFNDAIPEFRVGLILSGFGFSLSFYLLYAIISGAFGGLLRSRSRTP
jgi:hypothetical protein